MKIKKNFFSDNELLLASLAYKMDRRYTESEKRGGVRYFFSGKNVHDICD